MCTRATFRCVGVAAVLVSTASAAAQDCEPLWSDAFGLRWLDGFSVSSLVAFDDGTGPALYASGGFESDGERTLNHLARLTGNRWARVGPGVSPVADDMIYVEAPPLGPALYVCGGFSTAGTVEASGVARWDGTAWSALGEGLSGWPQSLAVFDDGNGQALYAGRLDLAGESTVVRWDGKSWSEVGGGVDGSVWDLVVFDDGSGPALYVGGVFDHAGGVPASNVARWDGLAWSPVGSGIGSIGVLQMAAVVNDGPGVVSGLYVGGVFDTAGGVAANSIARWDGREWSPVGYGPDDGWWVLAFEVYDDGSGSGPALFAASNFTQASGDPGAVGLGKWDGAAWSGVGGGVDVLVLALESFDEGSGPGLYAGGLFHRAGDVRAEHIARWNGQSWTPVASGGIEGVSSYRFVSALLPEPGGQGLFVAGSFTSAATTHAHSIARLDRDGWSALGDGVDGFIADLILFDDGSGPGLFAGGGFDHAGDEAAASIARWDGAAWSPLGDGIGGDVFALEVFDDGSGTGPALYAAGTFAHAGGVVAQNIARWDGEGWSAVGDIVFAEVLRDTATRDLAVHDDGTGAALYAGGDFDPDGSDLPSVRRWDGKAWLPVGDIGGVVRALAVFDDGTGPALYAGGFVYMSDDTLTTLARWDGESWTMVEDAPAGAICTLEVIDDGLGGRSALYPGGDFSLGGPAIIARWDGSAWSPLGFRDQGEESDAVCAIAGVADHDDLGPSIFAGGSFTSLYVQGAPGQGLDEIPSGRIGRWLLCPPPAGDVDGDGAIGVADIELLLDAWGACGLPCPPTCAGDVDHDCTVGVLDLLMLLAEWAP